MGVGIAMFGACGIMGAVPSAVAQLVKGRGRGWREKWLWVVVVNVRGNKV